MTDTPGRYPPPSVPGDTDAGRLSGLRTLTHVLYALYALHWFSGGITSVIAVIVNYVKRDDAAGTPYAAHFEWQIRTFWRTLIAYAIGVALILTVIGIVVSPTILLPVVLGGMVMFVTSLWTLYRIIKGWLYLYDNKALDPRAWF
ncbi:DUF4870 family protein [Burkholderia pseudomultivorans]|uniref:DUF4870 family protein n=1 Tax=Burkholderia pseudomultivorans TaxID=1207504 RepID=UPI00188E22F1|nr:hypothetical protein [Burkholderia pseudomultivorans]MBF5009292.1 hypothetical protein [Burkholderia pseudomultivorans]